jgi:hypothetical protein
MATLMNGFTACESEKLASMAAEAVLSAIQMHLRMEALLAHNVTIKMEDIVQATGKLIVSVQLRRVSTCLRLHLWVGFMVCNMGQIVGHRHHAVNGRLAGPHQGCRTCRCEVSRS